MGDWAGGTGATHRAIQFELPDPGWQGVDGGLREIEMVGTAMVPGFEQDLVAHLNDVCSDRSSPEYQKYRKYIPGMAKLLGEKFKLRFVRTYMQENGPVKLNESLDELFDMLGCWWLKYDQFEEALEAFKTCVEISEREGCWWPQKICARYAHLAFAYMSLGNKPEQLRASIQAVAFAIIGAKNISYSSSHECSRKLFRASLVNLAAQFVGRIPDGPSLKNASTVNHVQVWMQTFAERKRALEKNLGPGQRHSVSIEDDDPYFALADFLVCNDRGSFKSMLEILTTLSSGSLPASEVVGACDLQTSEFKSLMEICHLDTPGDERAVKHGEFLSFVVNVLEVATLEPPSQDKGWSLTCVLMRSLYTDEDGLPCYPGVCFSLSIKHESEAIQDNNSTPSDSERKHHSSPAHAGGSKQEELEAIRKRVTKGFDLRDPSDHMEFANAGRDFGMWATSHSPAAEAPTEDIIFALYNVYRMGDVLRQFSHDDDAAKSMLQDFVWRLAEQFNANVKSSIMRILLLYAQVCDGPNDVEERVKICTKALQLADKHGIDPHNKYGFYFFLGSAYLALGNLKEAEAACTNARHFMELSPDLREDVTVQSDVEGIEALLELTKADRYSAGQIGDLFVQHCKEAVRKLQNAVRMIEKQAFEEDYHAKYNFIKLSICLGDAHSKLGHYPDALYVVGEAYRVAKALIDTKNLKSSKKLILKAAAAASACGYINNNLNNHISAERFYREGLEILCDVPGSTDESLTAHTHVGLGRALRLQGRLSEAEDAFREALIACSRALTNTDTTSQNRIATFEVLQGCYNELQLCLYKIYLQVGKDERGTKALEALIVAEQGRCRDFMMNLETANESVLVDVIGDGMDWRKFDTDLEYAWRHLKNCMASCTDAIRAHNPEIQGVTFVEYTLTDEYLLIWVLHSRGVEDSSTSSPDSSWPSMYAVDVKANFQTEVDAGPRSGNLGGVWDSFGWMYGPHNRRSHFDHLLHKIQAFEAMGIFETRIEMLREAQGAGLSKMIYSLYNLVIKPIADELTIGEPLIFIPHEGLSYAPFAALKPKLKGSKHLIENHPIGYASSIRTLGWATNQFITLKAQGAMSSRHPMLLVGDPELPPEMNKDPIEDAALEVNAIASLLPTNYSNTLTKKQATLQNVSSAMKTASWFHIACHGEVSPDVYPQGALFLSCDSGDHRRHGCLTSEIIIHEVRCMSAQAAVLAACKAAQGKKTGEGILGLARALMQAGVPLVVAPLKTIDSKLGSAFMQRFYKGLVDGESVMFALRNTMVDVIHKKIPVEDEDGLMKWHLWDWAAWVAVGFPGVCLPI